MKEMDVKADQFATKMILRFHLSTKTYIEDYLKEGTMDTDSEGHIILYRGRLTYEGNCIRSRFGRLLWFVLRRLQVLSQGKVPGMP